MFYSHEILTSRKYGVATIWLVATLGQNSALRKVGRKAILDVNVTKACEVIITPEAPLALRLQSSLLYGISRVYSQQCGYVLADAQSMQTSIRQLLTNTRAENIDTSNKTKPQDLMLQDDPALLSDLVIPLDLDAILQDPFAMTYAFETQSSVGTGKDHSQQPQSEGIILPSDSSPGGAGGFRMNLGGSFHGSHRTSLLSQQPADAFLEAPLFDIDDEGFLVDVPDPVVTPRPATRGLPFASDSSGQVHRDHQLGLGGEAPRPLDEMDLDIGGIPGQDDVPDLTFDSSPPSRNNNTSTSFVVSQETEEAMVAPLRRTRTIQLDKSLGYRNTEMIEHNRNYVQYMINAQRTHLMHQLPAQSKKNADYFILGRGLSRIGSNMDLAIPHPLSMFSGNALFEWATGQDVLQRGQKRGQKRDSDSPESEERRVRQRQDDYEFGRGQQEDQEFTTMMQDDEIEMPREAAAELEDISSAMPWNISASLRGSSVPRGGSVIIPSSAKKSRLVSASPLQGRGASILPIDEDGFHILDDEPIPDLGPRLDGSPVVKGFNESDITLDKDSYNFLSYIQLAIDTKQADANQLAVQLNSQAEVIDQCTFEEVLPANNNSRKIAAHGLLHVLYLANKSVIKVDQAELFGSIAITVA